MSRAYYNEIDQYAARWLRNLITAGHIAPGDVDERSIEDVKPDDLKHYTQCHFFAGIGVWSYALRKSGWPDDRQVWTGSCPCQPFSAAGKGSGMADERHLWPAWHHLIQERRPRVVFGEQVASQDGLGWLDLVQADMEGTDYALGAQDRCSAGNGAPHIRQRLYWCAERVAHHNGDRCEAGREIQPVREKHDPEYGGAESGVGNALRLGRQQLPVQQGSVSSGVGSGGRQQVIVGEASGGVSGLADHHHQRREGRIPRRQDTRREDQHGYAGRSSAAYDRQPSPTNGFWRDADWLYCRDGKWRPVEPGTFPLAHGASSRVGRLRAYGNAIDAENATAFIEDCEAARADFISGGFNLI